MVAEDQTSMKHKGRGKHQHLDQSIRRSIEWMESLPHVKRVIPCRIECCKHKYSPGNLRVMGDERNGFRVNAYTGFGVRDIFVILDSLENREKTKTAITERFLV
jgi:hypothetical protein